MSDNFFDALLLEIKDLHDKKSHDYAQDRNRFSNFEEAGEFAGVSAEKVFETLLGIKQARLKELRTSGKAPNNESIRDTLLDRAVYSILALQYYDLQRRREDAQT